MRRKIRAEYSPKIKSRYLIIAVLFLLLVICGYGFLRKSNWDGLRRFTVIIQTLPQGENSASFLLSVFSIEPRQNRAVYFLIPANSLLEVPYGYQTYTASAVYKLGELDKEKKGGKLLAKSIEKTLGIAVDGYLICEKCYWLLPKSDTELKNFKQSYFTLLGVFRLPEFFSKFGNLITNFSLMDRLLLWNALRKIRIDQISFWDLEKNKIFADNNLADGTLVKTIEKDLFDLLVGDSLEDSLIRSGPLAIEIVNATNEEGLANQFSRILEHMGANVILKTTAKKTEKETCLLYFSQKNIVKNSVVIRLRELYGCQVKEQMSDLDLTQSDVKIVLGEGFLK